MGFRFYEVFRRDKSVKTKHRSAIAMGWARRNGEPLLLMDMMGFFGWADEIVLKLDRGGDCTTL